jgi:hypothetical protein
LTRDQEIWGIALWVERNHGERGPTFITEQIGRLSTAGDDKGISLWREVARRYEQLIDTEASTLQS